MDLLPLIVGQVRQPDIGYVGPERCLRRLDLHIGSSWLVGSGVSRKNEASRGERTTQARPN